MCEFMYKFEKKKNKQTSRGCEASPAMSAASLVNKSETVSSPRAIKGNIKIQRQTLTRREQISKRQSGEQAVSVVCVLGQLLLCANACVCCRCSNSSKCYRFICDSVCACVRARQCNKNIIYRRVQGVCLRTWAGDGLCLEFMCARVCFHEC